MGLSVKLNVDLWYKTQMYNLDIRLDVNLYIRLLVGVDGGLNQM